jgi:hypothetical protein
MEDPKVVTVGYLGKKSNSDEQGFLPDVVVGDELPSDGLRLDRSCPLMPFVVDKLRDAGPAQAAGVQIGWRFDLAASLAESGPSRDRIAALFNGMGDIPTWEDSSSGSLRDVLFGNIEETYRRLSEGLGRLSQVSLVFTDGASPSKVTLLPEARVYYHEGQTIGIEISGLDVDGDKSNGQLRVTGFAMELGPAQVAGVRTDWLVDVRRTLQSNPILASRTSELLLMDNPASMLAIADIVLVFVHPSPSPSVLRCSSGSTGWNRLDVPGDSLTFGFESDGDGADVAASRWGVWCMVMEKGKELSQEDFDDLGNDILDLEAKVAGVKGQPEVQREGWDENRLRALCARHGWDFSWMTEDDEGHRRAHERLALVDVPKVRPLAPDASIPDGAKGLTTYAPRTYLNR